MCGLAKSDESSRLIYFVSPIVTKVTCSSWSRETHHTKLRTLSTPAVYVARYMRAVTRATKNQSRSSKYLHYLHCLLSRYGTNVTAWYEVSSVVPCTKWFQVTLIQPSCPAGEWTALKGQLFCQARHTWGSYQRLSKEFDVTEEKPVKASHLIKHWETEKREKKRSVITEVHYKWGRYNRGWLTTSTVAITACQVISACLSNIPFPCLAIFMSYTVLVIRCTLT